MSPPHPETICVAAGHRGAAGEPVSPAVHLSTTFHQGGEYEYIRDASPTIEAFEAVVGALEGGYAAAFASGMAASAAVLDGLEPGARVVAPVVSYPGVRGLLAERAATGALEVALVDQTDTEAALAALDGARLVWAETPSNPLLGITDLAALAAAAHERGAAVAVDATLATPLLQRSLELGADFVGPLGDQVHRRSLRLAARRRRRRRRGRPRGLIERRALTGAVPGPFEVFLGLRGVRTLALRSSAARPTRRARAPAAEPPGGLAGALPRPRRRPRPRARRAPDERLRGDGRVRARGGAEAADAVCAAVRLIANATSLGGVES